jgi:transposase
MCWNGPIAPLRRWTNLAVRTITGEGDPPVQAVTTIGLDLAKAVFQVHGVNGEGAIMIRRALRRSQVLEFFRCLPPCLVGLEACGSSHYWAREIGAFGHQVRMIPPIYVKAYVKRGKTDAADAEAICEAVTRPTMRFVPIKNVEQQAAAMLLRTRELLVRQRSQLANAFRAQMSELGIVGALGMASITKLAEKVRDPNISLPPVARLALLEMAEQIDALSDRIERLGQEIQAGVKADETARRLTSIPGVGPLIAATIRATVNDIGGFKTGRDFAAWLGLTPRLLSSGGKDKLGSISKQGNRQLRTLLVVGASSIIKQAKRGVPLPAWLTGLMARKPYKLVAVALANKTARIIWALLAKGGLYRKPEATPAAA